MSDADRLSRRGRIEALAADAIEVRWIDAQCRGCVGCGGRCSLFARGVGDVERLPIDSDNLDVDCRIGASVDISTDPRTLRRATMLAYGLALVALLAGAALGHALGLHIGHANVGALLGLLAGTFAAGRLTKRLTAAPRLAARPCPEFE